MNVLPLSRTAVPLIFLLCTALPLTSQATTFEVLHYFHRSDGKTPIGALAVDAAGNLYGTTQRFPRLFRISSTGSFTVLHQFDYESPNGSLAIDGEGNVVGTTFGTIFRYRTDGTFQTLVSLTPDTGIAQYSGVAIDADGTFYGTSESNGNCRYADACGTVFKVPPGSSQPIVLHRFTGPDGARPTATPTLSEGILYGTTVYGGARRVSGQGVAFHMETDGSNFESVSISNGRFLYAGLAKDSQGNWWGVAANGGRNGYGGIYRIDPGGNDTFVHSFNYEDGAHPTGTLLLGRDGMFYGTTREGGGCYYTAGCGTIFRFDPVSLKLKTLHYFSVSDGALPRPQLVQDAAGNLYGVTETGGRNACGVVFKLTP